MTTTGTGSTRSPASWDGEPEAGAAEPARNRNDGPSVSLEPQRWSTGVALVGEPGIRWRAPRRRVAAALAPQVPVLGAGAADVRAAGGSSGGVAGGPAARPRRWPGWCQCSAAFASAFASVSVFASGPPPGPGRGSLGSRCRACPCCLSGAPCSAWRRVLRGGSGLGGGSGARGCTGSTTEPGSTTIFSRLAVSRAQPPCAGRCSAAGW